MVACWVARLGGEKSLPVGDLVFVNFKSGDLCGEGSGLPCAVADVDPAVVFVVGMLLQI